MSACQRASASDCIDFAFNFSSGFNGRGDLRQLCEAIGLAVMLTRAQIDLYTSVEMRTGAAGENKNASVWSRRSRAGVFSALPCQLFQPRILRVRRNKEERRRPSLRTLSLSKNARALTNPVDVFMSARKGVAPRHGSRALCSSSYRRDNRYF